MKNFNSASAVRRALLAAASIVALGVANSAYAQTSSTPSGAGENSAAAPSAEGQASNGAPDIVVTAQFRSERLQDTPIAITALSGESIENKALNNVADIAATAPNVNLTQGAAAYGTGLTAYIRGIGQFDTSFAFEPGVGLYVDDVYHGVLVGGLLDLLDLDRVEILRGPQGTLAGKNSIGGAIKLYSRLPEGSGEGYLQGTYGSFDRVEVRGAYDLRLTDNLSARFSGFSKRRDGHVQLIDFTCDRPSEAGAIPSGRNTSDCQVGTLGGIKTWGLRLSLRYEPTDDLAINIAGSLIRDDSETPGVEQIFANNPAAPPLNGVPYDTRFLPNREYVNYGTFNVPQIGWRVNPLAATDSDSISARIDYRISDAFQLTSITGYESIYGRYTQDGDGSPIGLTLTYGFQPYHQFTQELRLNSTFANGLVDTTIGGFYFDSKGHAGTRLYSAPALNFIADDPVTSESRSVFAHMVIHPTEDLNVTGGIRYTDDKKVYNFTRADPTTGLPPPIVGPLDGLVSISANDSVDYRVGADYRFNDEFLVYGNVSTGYKGGGVNSRPFIPSQAVPFRPERVTAFEVGFKSDLFDRLLRVNTSAFLNKYRDIVLFDNNGYPGAPGDPGYFPLSAVPFNAGDAEIKGIEVEAELRPAGGLSLSGSLSYLDYQYTRLDPNAVASGIGLNERAPFTPEWKWSVNASYEFEMANGSSITPQIFADYTGSYNTESVNTAVNLIDSRTVLNANITYRSPDEDWEIIGGVTNLTDKHYFTNAFDNSATTGTASAVVARPREFYVTLRRNF